MAIQEYSVMTPELRRQFLEKGWVKIEGAISLENIKSFSDDVWIRLGFDSNDKTTWEKEKVKFKFQIHLSYPLFYDF